MGTDGSRPGKPSSTKRSTLRDLAHLYAAADDLGDRCRSGEAATVLEEVHQPLAEAEAAGAMDLVYRLSYVLAMSLLLVGRFDDVDRACARVLEQAPEADPAWMSVAHALRGLAKQARGDYGGAVDDIDSAAVLLDDARPYGQPFITASHVLGSGFNGLRLYELALEVIHRVGPLVVRPGFGVSRFVHVLSIMTVELSWGMELDRLGKGGEARAHFRNALAAADEENLLAMVRGRVWNLRLRTRTGLCQALLGEAVGARADLEPTVAEISTGGLGEPPLIRIGLSDEALARIGLVRAYTSLGQRGRAVGEAGRAQVAAERTQDPKLILAAAWEELRLAAADEPAMDPPATVAEYAARLEEERWQERARFTRETRERLQAERERIRARRMSAEYLTDSVTGVPNRRHFELRLPEFMDRATTHEESVALGFVDLDSEVSTTSLVAVGSMLRERAAPDGFVARYGGSEFVVVLPRRSAKELAHLVAGVLEDRPNGADEPRPRVGIASVHGSASLAGLVAAADEALLAARRSGGGIRLGAAPPA